MRSALLWVSRNQWLARRLPRYRFARAAVTKFMPGEELADALDATHRFEGSGITAVLTRLGENLANLKAADDVAAHYLDALRRIGDRGLPAQISVKLTQLGLDISQTAATDHLASLARAAAPSGNVVWVDMEGSAYTDRTLDVFRAVLADHSNVGLCLQAYLRRTADDLDSLLESTVAIRLVKGAYNEPAAIAFPKKSDVDEWYEKLGVRLLEASRAVTEGPRPAFGTHDMPLVSRLAAAAERAGVPTDGYEVQMLYGIQPREQQRLAGAGHRVRVLISYGGDWFPWYVRRLAERPANVWFVVRSMVKR
jgi:proline dehydrogenase